MGPFEKSRNWPDTIYKEGRSLQSCQISYACFTLFRFQRQNNLWHSEACAWVIGSRNYENIHIWRAFSIMGNKGIQQYGSMYPNGVDFLIQCWSFVTLRIAGFCEPFVHFTCMKELRYYERSCSKIHARSLHVPKNPKKQTNQNKTQNTKTACTTQDF